MANADDTLRLTPYDRQQQESVLDLTFYSRQTHTQLDWYTVARWLSLAETRAYTAWIGKDCVGVLGITGAIQRTAWVRLFAVQEFLSPEEVGVALWQFALKDLAPLHLTSISFLVANAWVSPLLPLLGFRYIEDVVTFSRVGSHLPPTPKEQFSVHNAYLEHLPDLIRVDHSAFVPEWRMTADEIRQAQRQSASCTVAEHDGKVIGYQISTRHQNVGHLARLAVLPSYHGRGVGANLLEHLIQGFYKRGVKTISVNTQYNNTPSQRLYMRYGFVRTGFDLPVWTNHLG